MAYHLYTFNWKLPNEVSVESFCKEFNIAKNEIDLDFGVVDIDPEKELYCVRLTYSAAKRLGLDIDSLKGPFSDPKIEPFDLS